MVSLFLRSPIWDFHLVKSRLKTGIPYSPESDAPRSSLFASPPFHTTTFSPGGYMQCTYAQKILSRALSFLPPPPPIVGPHNLVSQHLRFHPSLFMCEGALVCILRTREPIWFLRSALNLLGPSLKIHAKEWCCSFAGTCSNALVRRKLTKLALGMLCCSVVYGCWIQVPLCICRS
jgi:hypothetical protein